MRGMVCVLQFFQPSDELLAKAPQAAEVWTACDLVDRADDLTNGISGVCYHDASGIGNSVVDSDVCGSTDCGS